ncbi:MAG: hypothetical protein A4E53_04652 [Pelotomaculum sp. PtaB.Bin104]|nr:MAG: hypothetical protein A4E53_04652 [Pelotomaculum sp. PtaB.Bin104]
MFLLNKNLIFFILTLTCSCLIISACGTNTTVQSTATQSRKQIINDPEDGTKLYYDLVINKQDYEKASLLFSIESLKKWHGNNYSTNELIKKRIEFEQNTWSNYSSKQAELTNFYILFSDIKQKEATVCCYVDIQWNNGLNWNKFYKIVHWTNNSEWEINSFESNASDYLAKHGYITANIIKTDSVLDNKYCVVRLYNNTNSYLQTSGVKCKIIGFDNQDSQVFESNYVDFYKTLTPYTFEDKSVDINTEKKITKFQIKFE